MVVANTESHALAHRVAPSLFDIQDSFRRRIVIKRAARRRAFISAAYQAIEAAVALADETKLAAYDGRAIDIGRMNAAVSRPPSRADIFSAYAPNVRMDEMMELLTQTIGEDLQEIAQWSWKYTSPLSGPRSLPSVLSLTAEPGTAAPPSHVFAVLNSATGQLKYYNVHAAVLALFSSHLPAIAPPSAVAFTGLTTDTTAPATVTLPVVKFPVTGNPELFGDLLYQLYTNDWKPLIMTLCPGTPQLCALLQQMPRFTFHDLLFTFEGQVNLHTLLDHRKTIIAFIEMVQRLGITDQTVWMAIDLAWRAVGEAISWTREFSQYH